jgi:two-component system phosphate regulon sensor histidine kinase PhoR
LLLVALAGAAVGFIAHIPIRQKRLEHWRGEQAQYAAQALKTIERLSRTIDSEPLAAILQEIDIGEWKWEPIDLAEPSLRPSWSQEPNGFTRMRLRHSWIDAANQPRNLVLVRRFENQEINKSIGDGSFSVSLGTLGGLLLGGMLLVYRKVRESEVVWLQATAKALRDGKGNLEKPISKWVPDRVIYGVYAISDSMKQQIDSVRASYENSSRAMANMPIGILSFDEELRLNFANPAGIRLLGIDRAELGKKILDVLRMPAIIDCIQATHESGQAKEIEYELTTEKRWLRLRTQPLRIGSSQVQTKESHLHPVLLTVTDETRLKQLENLRRDFTANVSHELKTPLSAIKAYAETLQMGASEDPEARTRFIERISEQATRLDVLIRDLLQLTRLQSQPDKPKLYSLKIFDLLEAALEDHRPIAEQRRVQLSLECDPTITVRSDLESLQTVVNNLLSNAIRYNKPEGKVTVRVVCCASVCSVLFADTGIGIPASDIDRVFERFYRVEKARSQDLGGTGLGLAIVKHVCQSIDAEISVRSKWNEGSVFELKLPLADVERADA